LIYQAPENGFIYARTKPITPASGAMIIPFSMDHTIEIRYDSEAADWLNIVGESGHFNVVQGLLPGGYDRCIKLFMPVGLTTIDGRRVRKTYRELAEIYGLDYTKSFSYMDIVESVDCWPQELVVLKEQNDAMMDNLAEVLGRDTACVFHGYGGDSVPEEFESPWTVAGKAADMGEVFRRFNKDNFYEFDELPNCVFAADKSWCMMTRIHQSGLLVLGCDTSTAERLLNQRAIDCEPLEYRDMYFRFIRQDGE
jgi:hypothetical protein